MLAVRVPTLLWLVGYVLKTVQPSSADKFAPILQPRMRRRVVSALIRSLITTLPPPHPTPLPFLLAFRCFQTVTTWSSGKIEKIHSARTQTMPAHSTEFFFSLGPVFYLTIRTHVNHPFRL